MFIFAAGDNIPLHERQYLMDEKELSIPLCFLKNQEID
jgi:hypothetical protein